LGAVLAVAAGTAAATAPASPDWRPDAATIARLESRLVLPPQSHVLGHYQRFYAGETVNGRRVVEGRLLWSRRATTRIVPPGKLPNVPSGGCDFIDLTYDVAADRMTRIACHGWS
jgi:hypothetical protein